MIYELDSDPVTGYAYEKMANHIAERIAAGELKPNQRLSAEQRLATEYGVSLGTARRATGVLRDRDLVITVRCKGTFVVKRKAVEQEPSGDALPEGHVHRP